MIVRNDCVTFKIMEQDINLYSDETAHGRNTVAEINGYFHYLGSELPRISSAIFTWESVNKRTLTEEEVRQVMIDNHIISEAI